MLTAYSRVTVVTAERTIDLALPSALPLADVLPQVMRYAAPGQADGPTTWTLGRLGGVSLSLSQTLSDAGVLDGDVLELRAQQDDVRPALVEDVRDAVEDSVDAAGGVWTTRTTSSFVVMAGAVTLSLLGLASWLSGGFSSVDGLERLDTPVSAGAAVVVLLFATWWADQAARRVDAQVAAAAAVLWGALFGAALGRELDLDTAPTLVVVAVAVAVVAGLARLLTSAATGHAAFAVVVLVAGLVQGVVGLVRPEWSGQSLRVLPVLAVLAVGVLPRVSLSVGGLASADYRVRHVGQLDLRALQRRYRSSNDVLVGALVGIAAVVVWGGVRLDGAGDTWDRVLGLSLAAAAVLRSRLFSRTQHMLALRVAGLVVGVVAAIRWCVEHPDLVPWLVVAGAGVLLAGIGLASLQMSEITRARVKRTLNAVEFLVVVDLLVVMAGALGVYGLLGGVFS